MPDELPLIAQIMHVDVTTDETQVWATVRLHNGNALRLPMTLEAAVRLSGLLDRVREKHGWRLPDVPINEDKLQ